MYDSKSSVSYSPAHCFESLVAESHKNKDIASEGSDISSCIGPGVLVVADMTDPLLPSDEANGIFQVLTGKFRTAHIPAGCGKLLALDEEAHKFMNGDKSDGLSRAIINAARLMRYKLFLVQYLIITS